MRAVWETDSHAHMTTCDEKDAAFFTAHFRETEQPFRWLQVENLFKKFDEELKCLHPEHSPFGGE